MERALLRALRNAGPARAGPPGKAGRMGAPRGARVLSRRNPLQAAEGAGLKGAARTFSAAGKRIAGRQEVRRLSVASKRGCKVWRQSVA